MKKYLLLLASLLVTSCSTELKYHMTNHRFLTPETKGAFLKGDVGVAYQLNQKVVLASAYDSVVFNLPGASSTKTAMEGTSEVNLPITLGLFNRLDVYTLDQKYGLKFQFLGSPENERKTGEWKAAIAAAYGAETNDSGGVTFSNGNSTRTYDTKIKLRNNSMQLLLGRRLEENVLLYLSLMRDYYNYDGTLTSNQFSTINVSGHSVNYGASLGVNLQSVDKHPIFLKLEGGVMKGKLDKNNSRTAATAGGDVGWGW